MKRKVFLTLVYVCFSMVVFSQTNIPKAVADAYLITRMAEKFHVQPKPLNDAFSAAMFDLLLEKLDPNRTYFLLPDITALQAFRYQLDDEIKNKKSGFLQQLTSIYSQRVQQKDTMFDNIFKTPFNFSVKEKYTVAEDTTYANSLAALRTKMQHMIKMFMLQDIVADLAIASSSVNQKKYTDSIEPIERKRLMPLVKRSVKRLLQNSNEVEKRISTVYCEALAECYDPHTNYFLPGVKEDFESHLGKKPLQLGFGLDEDENGHAIISDLTPGSPAYKSGQLNKDDKIQSIQWEGKENVNVADKDVAIISDMLNANNTSKVAITVKKADGTTRQVTLQKQQVDNGEDDGKVKSFILKGTKSLGYISLPAFYEDWEEKSNGVNGCANDVAKEILKLKKENIDGLIIDVRFNGGGSMQEAIDLAGIFIDAGPVGQEKNKEGKAYTLKDMNRGTIYDGPLAVMVNGYSASASEMFAGTLQDYNRAVIIGTPTYGKATAQVILPMDTTISFEENFQNKKAGSYIKMTISRLYRVNGYTAQATGVQPDIVLPDVLSVRAKREADNRLALNVLPIEPNKYYRPNAALNLSPVKDAAVNEINSSVAFAEIRKRMEQVKAANQKKDISLLLADAIAERKNNNVAVDEDDDEEEAEIKDSTIAPFSVINHAFENKRITADSSQKDMNELWKGFLLKDPYIKTVYKLMLLMVK